MSPVNTRSSQSSRESTNSRASADEQEVRQGSREARLSSQSNSREEAVADELIAALSPEMRTALNSFGLLRNVSAKWVQRVERLCRFKTFEAGHLLCRNGAVSTRLYFLLSGQVLTNDSSSSGNFLKRAGEFLPDAEFLANMAIRFDDLHKRVMLPTAIRHDWLCETPVQALEIKLEALLSVVCKSQSLYENLYNIATAHCSLRGIRHSFRWKASTPVQESNGMTNGRQKGEAEEQISFDSLTEKQKQRLRNAGLLAEDTMENTELVVQILRANEGMDVEALRTFQLFRMVDKMTLTRIANQLKPVDFKAGEMVLRAGEFGDSMYFINSGRVAAVVQGQQLRQSRRLAVGQALGQQ